MSKTRKLPSRRSSKTQNHLRNPSAVPFREINKTLFPEKNRKKKRKKKKKKKHAIKGRAPLPGKRNHDTETEKYDFLKVAERKEEEVEDSGCG